MSRDYHPTTSRRLVLAFQILRLQACFRASVLQHLRVFILSYGTYVENAVGRQDVLRASGGVLSSAAGDLDRSVVLEKIFIEGHVLGFVGEDGVVGLETVLLEQALVPVGFCLACCARDGVSDMLNDKCLPLTLDV